MKSNQVVLLVLLILFLGSSVSGLSAQRHYKHFKRVKIEPVEQPPSEEIVKTQNQTIFSDFEEEVASANITSAIDKQNENIPGNTINKIQTKKRVFIKENNPGYPSIAGSLSKLVHNTFGRLHRYKVQAVEENNMTMLKRWILAVIVLSVLGLLLFVPTLVLFISGDDIALLGVVFGGIILFAALLTLIIGLAISH